MSAGGPNLDAECSLCGDRRLEGCPECDGESPGAAPLTAKEIANSARWPFDGWAPPHLTSRLLATVHAVKAERDRSREEAAAWMELAKAWSGAETATVHPGPNYNEAMAEVRRASAALRALGIDPDAPEGTPCYRYGADLPHRFAKPQI